MVQTTERKRPDRGTILSMRSARDYPRSIHPGQTLPS